MKKTDLHIKDIIDLEYFLRRDENHAKGPDQTDLSRRDRDIYLKKVNPLERDNRVLGPAQLLRIWVEERRKSELSWDLADTIMPGELFEEVYRMLGILFFILGLITGSGLALSFLFYRGIQPLNVSTYVGIFVIAQDCLLFILIAISLIRILKGKPLHSSLIPLALIRLLGNLIVKLKQLGSKRLSGSMRGNLGAIFGIFGQKKRRYGSLLFWPIFILSQIFMISFNLGVIFATLLKVTGSDIAFGWQSTLNISADWLSGLVKSLAIPWSWFVPQGFAYPSLSQIEGSRIVLKEGIAHMATKDMISWWPFLCFMVLFYGLIPRIVLLIGGYIGQAGAIKHIDLEQNLFEKVLQRMKTPVISTKGNPIKEDAYEKNNLVSQDLPKGNYKMSPQDSYICLIPGDILDYYSRDNLLSNLISGSIGGILRDQFRIGDDDEHDQKILREIARLFKTKGPHHVYILREAWQPPIKEDILFLKNLRDLIGKSMRIRIGLMGRPGSEGFFGSVKDEEWRVWDHKIKGLGDPYINLERLVPHAG